MLSVALQGVVAQQLLPTADGPGRVPARRGAGPDAGRAQPHPRGQDAPDLLRDPDRRPSTACRRWTRRWPISSARARSPARSPSAGPRSRPSSRASWVTRTSARGPPATSVSAMNQSYAFRAIDRPVPRSRVRSRPNRRRRSSTYCAGRGLLALEVKLKTTSLDISLRQVRADKARGPGADDPATRDDDLLRGCR